MQRELWNIYSASDDKQNELVPLYIHLNKASLDDGEKGGDIQHCIENELRTHGLTFDEIKTLKNDKHVYFVFLIDGYDSKECRSNLYVKCKLYKWNSSCKVIFTCRTEYLKGDVHYRHHQVYFFPCDKFGMPVKQHFHEYRIIDKSANSTSMNSNGRTLGVDSQSGSLLGIIQSARSLSARVIVKRPHKKQAAKQKLNLQTYRQTYTAQERESFRMELIRHLSIPKLYKILDTMRYLAKHMVSRSKPTVLML